MRLRRWVLMVGVLAAPLVAPSRAQAGDAEPVPAPPSDPRLATMPLDVRPEPLGAPTDADRPSAGDVPEFGPIVGDETFITNAAPWHAAGITGAGVKIGVIDFFDVDRYWDVAEHGPLPVKGKTAKCYEGGADCTWRFFDGNDEGGDAHGVAVVEVLRDMAPDAEIFIGSASTVSDYHRLIDWFARAGVTIVNRSLGSRYDGPGDGRGGLDEVAAYANRRGITWINSGGNNANGRYYRQAVRLRDGRVMFGPDGQATALEFNGCVSLAGIRWANDWDRPPGERTDYDAYLWDSPRGDPLHGAIVASSEARQREGAAPLENFPTVACPSGSQRALYLELRWRGGAIAGDVIEVLDYGEGIADFAQAEHSASTPVVDSKQAGVVSVGAIDPPRSGTIGFYSSQGPTNDGRIAPSLAAPSGFASTVLGGGFSGTSAAAPVVAGAAALLLDARLASDPTSLGNLLRHLALDRGSAGPDNRYGAGEFRLPEPPAELTAVPSRFEAAPVPLRVLDTRPESAVGPAALIGSIGPGEVIDLPLAGTVPADTTAVAVNITVTQNDRPSYLQALPTLEAGVGAYSNVNLDAAGETRANMAIVPVSAQGSISLYLTGRGHVVVDLLGSFRRTDTAVAAGRFVALDVPQRVLDTREGRRLRSGESAEVPLPSSIDPAAVDALVVTVVGTRAPGPGWVQAYPSGRRDVVGTTSTINVAPGSTVANTAIVPVGSDGRIAVALFVAAGDPSGPASTVQTGPPLANRSADVVVDVVGYITSDQAPTSTEGRYVPLRPGRAFDSRRHGPPLGDGAVTEIDADRAPGSSVPDSSASVVWNVAHVAVTRPGYGRVWASGTAEPATSSFNFSTPGEVRATAVISAVSDARADLVLRDGGHDAPLGAVVVDVFGYFT